MCLKKSVKFTVYFVLIFLLFSMVLIPLVEQIAKLNVANAQEVGFEGSTVSINKSMPKVEKNVKLKAKVKLNGEKLKGYQVAFLICYTGPYYGTSDIGCWPNSSQVPLPVEVLYANTNSKGTAQVKFKPIDIAPDWYFYEGEQYIVYAFVIIDNEWYLVGNTNFTSANSEEFPEY